VMEFEAIVADMSEHVGAVEGLKKARGLAEGQRRQELVARLLQDAKTQLDEREFALCLEILRQAEAIPPPDTAADTIASLRSAGRSGLAKQEALQQVRREAEEARQLSVQARRQAQAQSPPQYAPDLWNEAEAVSARGRAAFAQEAYPEARTAFE